MKFDLPKWFVEGISLITKNLLKPNMSVLAVNVTQTLRRKSETKKAENKQ